MPFGLTNAPATFQSLMNDVFQPNLRKFIIVFFDGILNYNATPDLHKIHLYIALSQLTSHQLYVNTNKWEFGHD